MIHSRVPRRAPRRALVVAAGVLAWTAGAACTVPPPTRGAARAPLADVPRERQRVPAVTASSDAPRRLAVPHAVRVRLEAREQAALLEVLLADGTPVTVRREGAAVVARKRAPAPSVTLFADQDSALRIDGLAYPGALIVTPHPVSGLRVHNEVAFETYVAGVVAAELALWSAAPAELEAQAIAARTYAALQLVRRQRAGEPLELVDGVMDQAYRGLYQPKSAGERAVAERLDAAVRATAGIVLVRGESFEEARFHASCGGRTASFADIFPEPEPGPPSVPCEACQTRARAEAERGAPDPKRPLGWKVTVPQSTLARAGAALGLGGPIVALGPKTLDASGRWIEAQVRGPKGLTVVPFDALRRALGYGVVKSARITRAVPPFGQSIRAGVVLEGLGRGHGVGLCQEGARDLARAGWTAERILAAYYPGARLVRAGDASDLADASDKAGAADSRGAAARPASAPLR